MLRKVVFNNFKCMFGQKKYGVQLGGDTILKHMNIIPSYNININSKKDYRKGYEIVANNILFNKMNINIGGDHSISVSTIQPLLDKYKDEILVIWIDAHADINTFISSYSNNMHGMPLSCLMGYMPHWYNKPCNLKKFTNLHKKNLLYVGLRDTDMYERKLIERKKITYFKTFSADVLNIIENSKCKYIYISCDVDSMDPSIMPSTGTPVAEGLLLKDVIDIINISRKKLVGFDLVEFNPMIGSKKDIDKTLDNISKIILQVKLF